VIVVSCHKVIVMIGHFGHSSFLDAGVALLPFHRKELDCDNILCFSATNRTSRQHARSPFPGPAIALSGRASPPDTVLSVTELLQYFSKCCPL
jgi:hypothetical protein